jgi:hypothetical protein
MLPGLDGLGSKPPIGKQNLLEHVADAHGPIESLKILFLSDDLMQREALLANEIDPDQADMVVLPVTADDGETDLPACLRADESENQDHARMAVDALWTRYFRHAARVARRTGSRFLPAWIGYEVGLRNALACARAASLDLDPTAYLVTPELADRDLDVSALLSAWSSAADPLGGLELLDKARWQWLAEHDGWYSFAVEEIEAYAAKLLLLHRWHRLSTENLTETK